MSVSEPVELLVEPQVPFLVLHNGLTTLFVGFTDFINCFFFMIKLFLFFYCKMSVSEPVELLVVPQVPFLVLHNGLTTLLVGFTDFINCFFFMIFF